MLALEAGGSAVVRGDWYKHISAPLQTGTGQARAGPGTEGTRRGSPAHTSRAHRPAEVPDLSGDVGARPTARREEQGVFQGGGRGGPRGARPPLSPAPRSDARRGTTTGSSPPSCGGCWATSPTASSSTSPPASRGCSFTRTRP